MAYPIAGKSASIKFSSGVVGNMHEWSLNATRDVHEKSAFGSTHKEFVAGLVGLTGSINGYFNPDDSYQKSVHDAILAASPSDTPITLQLLPDGTDYYQVSAIITAANVTAAVGGIVAITMDFQVTGAPTPSFS